MQYLYEINYSRMTKDEIVLVKRSWRLLRDIDPSIIAATFYGKLFTDKPALRRLFPKEMNLQHQKLMDMINTIVARLDNTGNMDNEIISMGKRHTGYAVKPDHYKTVGIAFIWTLEQGLGPDFTPEVKDAWIKCYNEISRLMLQK